MKRLLFILALAFAYFVLEVAVCSGQNYVLPNNNASCPGSCRQITWLTGSDIWNGGTLPSYTGVTCAGLHNNGSTDDGPLIQACINALSSNQCAVIPAGTNYLINSTVRLKSNTCLRGAQAEGGPPFLPTGQAGETRLILGSGAQLTTQNFSFASGNIYPATSFNTFPANYCTLSGTPQKGNTTVVNSSADVNCTLHVDDMIAINGNDDPSLISATGQNGHCDWCGDGIGFYVQQQLVQVTAVTGGGGSGSTITLSKALYYTPDPTSRVVPGPSGSGTRTEPAGVKFQIFTMPTAHAGFENLRIDGSVHDIGSSQILWVQGCFECWVKNVETYMTGSSSGSAHIELDWSYGNEVRDSAFHDQRSGASGAGYGTYFQFTNSDNKVENNILYHNRHSVVFQGGGSGNAWMYNYADDGYTDDLTFFAQATVSHGGHPYFNLFEGNIMSHFGADDFWGSSSHNVVYRNWFRGGEPNRIYAGGSGIPSFPPNNGFAGFSLYTGQPYYSFVNNVLGSGNLGSGVTPTWSGATLSGYNNSAATATPIVYSYGGSASWFSGSAIPSSQTTAIRQGNYDYKTLGVAFNDGGAGFTYQPSYYYASEPAWYSGTSCDWPAQGSDLAVKGSLQQPAYMRATSGACSGSPTFTLSTATTGTGSGTVTGCAGAYSLGDSYSCLANATGGSTFASWSSTCGGTASGTTYAGSMPGANCSVTASFQATVANPTFLPIAGTYVGAQSVAINDLTTGAAKCFTLDGSTPTSSAGTCTHGTAYTTPIPVSSAVTIKAIGTKAGGYTDSSVVSAAYVINYTLSVSQAGTGSGTITGSNCATNVLASGTSVTCSETPAGGSTFLNWSGTGSASGCSSTCTFTLTQNSTVTANFQGTIATPTFNSPAGSYASPTRVAISSATTGSSIFYTVDGTSPTIASARYRHPVYVGQSQTLNALAVKAGWTNSAIGSAPYTIAVGKTRFTLLPVASGSAPPSLLDDRPCCAPTSPGVTVEAIEPVSGTFTWTAYDAWVATAAAHGATFTMTYTARPSWMTGSTNGDGPPSDLTTPTVCPATGTTTTDCSMKTFTIAHMKHVTGLSSQPVSPVTCNHLDRIEMFNEVNTDSSSVHHGVGWNGTFGQAAQVASDSGEIVHLWCSNTIVDAGSVSAIVGFHANGDDSHYDVYAKNLLTATLALSNPDIPDALSIHMYPARQTVSPVPFPTTTTSNSDPLCTGGSTVSCYVPIYQQVTRVQGAATLQNAGLVSTFKFLPVVSTEGGFGELQQLCTLVSGTTLCQGYVSQYMLAVAAQKVPVAMLYAANDGSCTTTSWGCYWNNGTSPWFQAFTETSSWLNAHTITSAWTPTAITGGNKWTLQLDSGAEEIANCDAWLANCTTSTSFTNQTDLNGIVTATGGALSINQLPVLLTSTTFTLSTSTSGTGTGTITGCAGSYPTGGPYSCTVAPGTGSHIASIAGCGGSGTTTYAGLMPGSNCTVLVTFTLDTFTLTTSLAGTGGGAIAGTNCVAATYNYGTAIICTEAPVAGSVFAGWSGGVCSGTGGCSFSLAANSTVTATFNLSGAQPAIVGSGTIKTSGTVGQQ